MNYNPLVFSWIVLTFLFLWWMIRPQAGSYRLRFLAIPLFLWYSVALCFVPNQIVGWPHTVLPDEAIILHYRVVSPRISPEEAGIYLWMLPSDDVSDNQLGDPRTLLTRYTRTTPRAYKLPWTEQKEDELKKQNEKKKHGLLLWIKNKRMGQQQDKGGSDRGHKEEGQFKIVNPEEILSKDD